MRNRSASSVRRIEKQSHETEEHQSRELNPLNQSREENLAQNQQEINGANDTASFEVQSSPGTGWKGDTRELVQTRDSDDGNNNLSQDEGQEEEQQQVVQHVIVSDEQLMQRCRQLEHYCKELVQTNKVLDMENRVAIA